MELGGQAKRGGAQDGGDTGRGWKGVCVCVCVCNTHQLDWLWEGGWGWIE